jgi:hypothetical protein
MTQHFVGSWTVAPAPAEGVAFNNITLRMNGRLSLGGAVLRVRLSNAHGIKPSGSVRHIWGCVPAGRRSFREPIAC